MNIEEAQAKLSRIAAAEASSSSAKRLGSEVAIKNPDLLPILGIKSSVETENIIHLHYTVHCALG